MQNHIFLGVSSIAILLGMAMFAFFHRNKYSIWYLIILGFFLRLIPAQDVSLHEWDERFHALVAKNMAKNVFRPTLYNHPVLEYNYQNWTDNHIWLHKQPLSLWLIHFSLKIFGYHAYAVRIPSVILSSICMLMTYIICFLLFERRNSALLAAFFQGVNGFVIANAAGRVPTDHIDCHFLFFTELTIFLMCLYWKYTKIWFLPLIGIALGLSILTKWIIALFVLPLFWILLRLKISWQMLVISIFVICSVAAIIALPWQVYIFEQFPMEAQWESIFNFKHLYEAIEGHSGNWYYHLDKARMIWNELIYLPFIWLLIISIRNKINVNFFLLIWIIIPYTFFSAVHTKMTGYVLITAPAIFITIGLWIEWLQKYPVLQKIMLICFILLALRYSIEKIKPFNRDTISEKRLEEVHKIQKHAGNEEFTVVFNFPYPIEAMFFTNCTVYSKLPSVDYLNRLESKGYRILLYEHNKLPSNYLHLSTVKVIR